MKTARGLKRRLFPRGKKRGYRWGVRGMKAGAHIAGRGPLNALLAASIKRPTKSLAKALLPRKLGRK